MSIRVLLQHLSTYERYRTSDWKGVAAATQVCNAYKTDERFVSLGSVRLRRVLRLIQLDRHCQMHHQQIPLKQSEYWVALTAVIGWTNFHCMSGGDLPVARAMPDMSSTKVVDSSYDPHGGQWYLPALTNPAAPRST